MNGTFHAMASFFTRFSSASRSDSNSRPILILRVVAIRKASLLLFRSTKTSKRAGSFKILGLAMNKGFTRVRHGLQEKLAHF